MSQGNEASRPDPFIDFWQTFQFQLKLLGGPGVRIEGTDVRVTFKDAFAQAMKSGRPLFLGNLPTISPN